MFHKIRYFFKNLNIRFKFFLTCVLMVSLSLAIFFLCSILQIKKDGTDSEIYNIEHSSLLAQKYINKSLHDITDISYLLSNSHNIAFTLCPNSNSTPLSKFKNLDYIDSTFAYYSKNTDVISIELYVNENCDIFIDNSAVFPIQKAQNEEWFKIITDNEYLFFTYIGNEQPNYTNFSTVAAIRNPYNLIENIGYIKINLNTESIKNILLHSTISEKSITALSDTQTGVIYASDDELFSECGFSAEELSKIPFDTIQVLKSTNNRKYHIIKKKIDETCWEYFSISPVYEIYKNLFLTVSIFLIIFIVLLLVTYILSYIFSLSITKPIDALTQSINSTRLGQFKKINMVNCSADMQEIFSSYNDMMDSINTLIAHEFESGIKFEKMEMELLQSQINPHFLYNTLDLIKSLATLNDTETIRNVVGSLAKFYKLSLHNGKNIVTIKDELDHIINYVNIQNTRFDNAIKLIIDIPPDIEQLSIPKLTFQPIVENAIYHGIFMKKSHSGTIHITAKLLSDYCQIIIADDGIGIPADKLTNLTLKDASESFGLYNINRRLQILYGSSYGINISSKEGEYTEVIIKIPSVAYYDKIAHCR